MPSGRVMQTPRTQCPVAGICLVVGDADPSHTVSSDWHIPSGRVMQTPRTQCPVTGICLVVG